MSETLDIKEKINFLEKNTGIITAIITVFGVIYAAYFGYLGVVEDKNFQIKNKELEIQSTKNLFERQIQELKMKLDFATIEAIKNERDKAIAERNTIFSENQELKKNILAQNFGLQKTLQLQEENLNKKYQANLEEKRLAYEKEVNLLKSKITEINKEKEELMQSLLEQACWNDLLQIKRNPFWFIRVFIVFISIVIGSFILYIFIYVIVWIIYFFKEYFKKIYIDEGTNIQKVNGKYIFSMPLFYKKIKNGGKITFYFKGKKHVDFIKAGLSINEIYEYNIEKEEIQIQFKIRKRYTPSLDISFPFKLKIEILER